MIEERRKNNDRRLCPERRVDHKTRAAWGRLCADVLKALEMNGNFAISEDWQQAGIRAGLRYRRENP